jgi:LuxR family maltose regulon positive regulatory protein
MVARQQVSGFDLEELAFRPDEFRLLYEQNYGIRITDAAAQELVHQTEGWITGLHLSAQDAIDRISEPAGRGAGLGRVTTARATGVDLDVYLDQQVLSQQTPELRSFLLQTSLLDEFDVRLCEQVLGEGNWRRLLETVRSNNLFILPVGPQGKWLRYHHLFQDFLQARILQEAPDTARLIQERLAEVYEQRHEWERAFALLRQIGDREALISLVERAGNHLLLGEHLITLQSWLEAVPGVQLQQKPILLSLKGALLCGMGDGRAALTLLDQAVLLHKQADDQAGLALAHVRRAATRRILGDYSGSVADADDALRIC